MRKIVLAWMTCLSTIPLVAHAQANGAPTTQVTKHTADVLAITSAVAGQDAAWDRGDAPAYVQSMLPEATCTNIVGVYFPDRDAFMKNMSDVFAGLFKGSVNHQTVQSIRFVAPDIAIVDTISALSGMARVPVGAEAVGGVMHSRPEMVMVRRPDGWRITSFHNVTINPRFLPPEAK